MASILNPYLSFSSTAREAMEFYKSVLGGELQVMTFGQMGQTENADAVMHSSLVTTAGYTLFAADTMAEATDSRVTISISGDDADELHGYFTGLSEGGQVTLPLAKQVWGDEFGMFTDKYGIAWMVNINAGEAQQG